MKMGKVIRKRRLEKKLTQAELARILGISTTRLSRIELDQGKVPSLTLLSTFIEVFQIKLLDFFTERIDLYETGSPEHIRDLKTGVKEGLGNLRAAFLVQK